MKLNKLEIIISVILIGLFIFCIYNQNKNKQTITYNIVNID